jgi:glycosylphosphatidylinositol transamidase
VISDSHLDGMHAWLSAYNMPSNTRASSEFFKSMFLNGHVDLDVEPLSITSGVVWTALNIDYPGHSFSHLGVFRGATSCFSLKVR